MSEVTATIVTAVLCSAVTAYSLGSYVRFHYPVFRSFPSRKLWSIRGTTVSENSQVATKAIGVIERQATMNSEIGSPAVKTSRKAVSEDKASLAGAESEKQGPSEVQVETTVKADSANSAKANVSESERRKPRGAFHYLRMCISFFSMCYPTWLLVTYFTIYPETTAPRICNVLTRIDNLFIIGLRTSVLVFYILRLKLVMINYDNVLDKILFPFLTFGVVAAFVFGFLMSIYMEPYPVFNGCSFSVQTMGLVGYSTFVAICFVLHLILFLRFIFALKIEKTSLTRMKSSTRREKQFEDLIKKTKISFYVYSFFASSADLFYILINNVYAYEVYEGPNWEKLQFLLTIMNTLYFLDVTAGAVSILSTHSRFKEMLFCGLRKVEELTESKA